MLTKYAVVLRWFESMNSNPERFPPEPADTGRPQVFALEEAPPYAMAPGTVIRLDYDTWQDMGGPTEITVTVEPGDLLNV